MHSGDTLVPAYRAQPLGKTHLPVIIVVHEVFGVHEHIADVCRRFAKFGYLAIAPDLFVREGDASAYPTIQQLDAQLSARYRTSRLWPISTPPWPGPASTAAT